MTQKPRFTHVGWFYFVPINYADDGEGFIGEMRWTGWQWPLALCCWVHNLLNELHGTDSMFPIRITGEKKQ